MKLISSNIGGKYLFSHLSLTPSTIGDVYVCLGDVFYCYTNLSNPISCSCIYKKNYADYDYVDVAASVKDYSNFWKDGCEDCWNHGCSPIHFYHNKLVVAIPNNKPAFAKLNIDYSNIINSYINSIDNLPESAYSASNNLKNILKKTITLSEHKPIIKPKEISGSFSDVFTYLSNPSSGDLYTKSKQTWHYFVFDDVKAVSVKDAGNTFGRDSTTLIQDNSLALKLGFSLGDNYVLAFKNFYEISPISFLAIKTDMDDERKVIGLSGSVAFYKNFDELEQKIIKDPCNFSTKYRKYFLYDSLPYLDTESKKACEEEKERKQKEKEWEEENKKKKNSYDLHFEVDGKKFDTEITPEKSLTILYDLGDSGASGWNSNNYNMRTISTTYSVDSDTGEVVAINTIYMPSMNPEAQSIFTTSSIVSNSVSHYGYQNQSYSGYHNSTNYTRLQRRVVRRVKKIPPSVNCKLNVIAMYSPNIAVFSLSNDVKYGTATNFNPHLVALIDFGDGSKQKIYPHRYRTTYVAHTYNNSNEYKVNVYLHTGYSNIKSQCSTPVNFEGKVLPKGIIPLSGYGELASKKSSFIKDDSEELIVSDPMEVGLADDFKDVFSMVNPFISLVGRRNV